MTTPKIASVAWCLLQRGQVQTLLEHEAKYQGNVFGGGNGVACTSQPLVGEGQHTSTLAIVQVEVSGPQMGDLHLGLWDRYFHGEICQH